MKKTRKRPCVVIHVRGGVAYLVSAPKTVDVRITDFDNRDEEDRHARKS